MGESSIFKVLSDPQRRDILVMLREGRMSAGEIAEKLGVSPPALSYHLRLLKGAELVTEYKEKNFVYYELNTSVLQELILWVEQLEGGNHEKNSVVTRGAYSDGYNHSSADHACFASRGLFNRRRGETLGQ